MEKKIFRVILHVSVPVPVRNTPIYVYASSEEEALSTFDKPILSHECRHYPKCEKCGLWYVAVEVDEIPAPEPVYDVSYDGSWQHVGEDRPHVAIIENGKRRTLDYGGNTYAQYRAQSGNNP